MPGLSQLKKFSSDLLNLGDEVIVRSGRGEKPVEVPIPKDVQDVDDSEDFVLGMPEGEELVEDEQIDEDLSDLAGIANNDSVSDDEEKPVSFETPDMSGLLDPLEGGDFGADDMPDLSMFADEPAEEETVPEDIVEEEPEEVSVADMSLDDLLSGGGFDEPEHEEEDDFAGLDDSGDNSGNAGVEAGDSSFGLDDFGNLEDLDEVTDDNGNENIDGGSGLDDFGDFGNFNAGDNESSENIENGDDASLDDFFYEPFGNGEEPSDNDNVEDAEVVSVVDPKGDDVAEDISEMPAEPEVQVFDEPENSDFSEPADSSVADSDENSDDISELADFSDFENSDNDNSVLSDLPDMSDVFAENSDDNNTADISSENPSESDGLSDFNELPDFNEDNSGSDSSDNFDIPDFSEAAGADENPDDFMSGESVPDIDDLDSLDNISFDDEPASGDFDEEPAVSEDFGNSDIESIDESNGDNEEPLEDVSPEELDERFADSTGSDEDLDSPFDDFSTDDLDDLPDMSDIAEPTVEDLDIFSDTSATPESAGLSDSNDDFGLSDLDDSLGNSNITANDDIPDYGDLDIDEGDGNSQESLETFDTSEMDGLDFDIPDTDSQLESAESGDDGFEFGDEFEIPGFSDVDTVGENNSKSSNVASHNDKKKKGKHTAAPVKTEDNEDDEKDNLPPNTLSDKQYKTFLKNLNEYPLNVRLAFEELMVKDEFTDDAEFEIIELILNKASARQVASKLEKMLDVSIPVPRDYEHRSAEEYEAYKKSLSYQLKNKIIPAILLGIVGILVCIGLFNFGKNCIYKPLKANSLYKQGYVLIQESEYPLSEIKFKEATEYRLSKKWFFNYARGYREHKQYQRAGKMYKNILYCFNHDKSAGLEYADMELNDLANYERAEEIVRREVLDYHINDADGILKLGDIFLEWGTEKDSAKLEDAREQYATLLQLYGQTDLYLSRMMRYFIRTDNLREVLQLKQHFEPEKDSLCADDWTELSGYLLDKYYGELSPSEEYLRYEIEGLRSLLLRAVESNPENPVALYNLAKYFINTSENEYIESTLQDSIEKFNSAKSIKNRDLYKYIDAYRLLGEYYLDIDDFLQAQEQFAEGISLYITERDNAGFKGNKGVGKLYEDMGNLKYSISGDYDEALLNYNQSVNLGNDSPSIRYRIGYVQYHNRDYDKALSSFMKAGDGNTKERNLLLAMANTLSIRGNDYAAEGYYGQLIETLDSEIANEGLILPQANEKDYNIINTYLCASNNYGVTLYRLAKKTGDSSKNAEAIVQFSESLRAWDALTRNPETMIRLEGSNLAEQNIKYITHPISEFEPAIYTSIPKTLLDNEGI